jgi:hypothetical protein
MRTTGTAVVAAMLMLAGNGRLPAQTTEADRLAQGWRAATLMADTLAALPAGLTIPASRSFKHQQRFRRSTDGSTKLNVISVEVTASWNPNHMKGFEQVISAKALGRPPFVLVAEFGYKGSEPRSLPRYVVLSFGNGETQFSFRFQDDHSVRFVVDDTLTLISAEQLYDGRIDTTSAGGLQYGEWISAILTLDQYLRIVDGKKVSVSLGTGRAVWTFRDEELEAMRDLASRMRPKGK